ncbi:MAG TPA: hypothetical protein VN238_22805 [Solirubrobacteraceae bacterium]|nr:hypothetical protein [Solirubrobacteraceae bacterium]
MRTGAFRNASFVLAVLTTLVGLAMLATTIANGGGPLALGTILGVLLTAFGVLRGWLQVKTGGMGERG